MAQRAWTFTIAQGDAFMLKPSYALVEVIDEFHKDAAIRESTQRTYASLHGLFKEFLRARGIASPTLTDLSHENALAFSLNFRPKDKQAGRYRERNALIALKALANWLAEKRLWYEARSGDYLSVLRDVKLPPIPSLGRKPFHRPRGQGDARGDPQGRTLPAARASDHDPAGFGPHPTG